MPKKKFISIIWGYSTHMYGFAPEENYHLHALKVAKDMDFEPYALVKGSRENMMNDPNFDSDIKVIDYKNIFQFFYIILKFSIQNSVFYVNSYEWQSFAIPFLARRTIFMAHTQPKRQSFLRQKIQNFVYNFFSVIRLNNETEKDFLINQGTALKKLSVVPLVVSQNVFRYDEFSQRNDLVYFGNVTEKKNLPTILAAFEIVKKNKPNTKLNIIGTIYDDNVLSIINNSLYKEDIILHGFLPNEILVKELNKTLIYLNSSFDEGQCVAVYDSALSGCVLCLPKIMSFTGIFKDSALFHDVMDHKQLAQNILIYLEDSDLVKEFREYNIKMIKNEYSIETVENKLKNLILQV